MSGTQRPVIKDDGNVRFRYVDGMHVSIANESNSAFQVPPGGPITTLRNTRRMEVEVRHARNKTIWSKGKVEHGRLRWQQSTGQPYRMLKIKDVCLRNPRKSTFDPCDTIDNGEWYERTRWQCMCGLDF